MSFKYKAVQRNSQPGKKGGTLLWYASNAEREEITLDELAREIAHRCTLSITDTRAVISAVAEVVPDYLSRGYIVRLDELGDLRVALSSEGTANETDVSAALIREAHVNFRSGSSLVTMLKTLEYKKA